MRDGTKKISIQVRMPPALLQALDKNCKKQHRSRAAEIIMRLEESLASDVNQSATVSPDTSCNTQ